MQAQKKINLNLEAIAKKKLRSADIEKDERIQVNSILISTEDYSSTIRFSVSGKDSVAKAYYGSANDFVVLPRNLEEFWKTQALFSGVYHSILTNGYQDNRRQSLEETGIKSLGYLEEQKAIYEDLYLEEHILGIIHRLTPMTFSDGRKGQLSLKLVKSMTPEVTLLPNGTLLVNTGLLCVLKSDQELAAVLANKIAAFMLDSPNRIFNGNELEEHSENATRDLFSFLELDPKVIASTQKDSLLWRYNNLNNISRDYTNLTAITYPKPIKPLVVEPDYERLIAGVLSYTSQIELHHFKHYNIALQLVNRLIALGVATEEDYSTKATILTTLRDDTATNQEAYDLLQKALTLHIFPISNIYKQLAMVCLRLNKREEAVQHLNTYLELLKGEKNSALISEIRWCVSTLLMINGK